MKKPGHNNRLRRQAAARGGRTGRRRAPRRLGAKPSGLLAWAQEQARLGHWAPLTELDDAAMRQDPDCAELQVLAAVGHLQLADSPARARALLGEAMAGGADREAVARALLTGAQASLARLAVASEESAMVPASATSVGLKARVRVDDAVFDTRLVPNHKQAFTVRDEAVHYALPGTSPGYLVTSEQGDFERPPAFHQIRLQADTAYEVQAELSCRGSQHPTLWVFEYAAGKRVNSRPFPVREGRVHGYYRTGSRPEAFGFGLRVGGEGVLDPGGLALTLRSGPTAELAQRLNDEFDRQLSKGISELKTSFSKNMETIAQRNRAQLEALVRLQHYLGDGFILPDMGGWTVTADFGLLLVRLLEQRGYDAVVEFGSGVSTLLVARALQKLKALGRCGSVPFVSFDHLEFYAGQTRQRLLTAGVDSFADVVTAPLEQVSVSGRGRFLYYACGMALQKTFESVQSESPRVLVLVDGPPAATGQMARYPALQSLQAAVGPDVTLDFLLDDYIRAEEREIVEAWTAEIEQQGGVARRELFPKLEKQACLLEVRMSQI